MKDLTLSRRDFLNVTATAGAYVALAPQATDADALSGMLDQLEDLSDEEIQALLAADSQPA